MSKTLTKKLADVHIEAPNLQKAFDLLGLAVKQDAQFQLYGRRGKADLVIPAEIIRKLGLDPLKFSDGIGIDIHPDGSAALIYDHYNQRQATFLEDALGALNELGRQADQLRQLQAEGYLIEPAIKEGQLALNVWAPEAGTSGWGEQAPGGGAW